MAANILPSRFIIASNGSYICISAIFPKPNFAIGILALLVALTMVALATTGPSLIAIFLISLSLGANLLALESEIRKFKEDRWLLM